ncbi:tRNA delta (2)-isopentenylpyrophosphate transferase [Theileria orientalis strain Shintoku]|uniref:tRNA dimethylallyltransferase n=1 Tax=Theileria orientalis strain Shintoku TaxID=869250 RepID=J4DNG7_THEOR|nr:tRNA delta (2)-isopentenylpyrophosphate transferase [Theileria orientalis strain Shintoku]BAM38929.1 tRNA delta (2)-isopentenylpyrophosphate transferase [Theileria orientalis strain Shintoku]|eukprot:XP_009689230.1 tRNA delta (2)-isopentenylpyrophosphate transferase [Theileria orientalis strain Shintoku]
MFRDIYYGFQEFERATSLKQFIMNEMGWKLRFIPIDEWKYNISDADKKNYLSRFICKYYVDTQFDKNPPWVLGFWETDFVKDSKSMPSIEIKLAPPENPLPQVENEVKLLESNRVELEEGMMSRLEQEYNNALMTSRERIKNLINDSLSVFDNKELIVELLSKYAHKSKNKNHVNTKLVLHFLKTAFRFQLNNVSFLQMDEAYVPSSVRVMVMCMINIHFQMSEVEPPDPAIKEKMEQIEQARNDEEIHAFYQEAQEFEQLTQVTLIGMLVSQLIISRIAKDAATSTKPKVKQAYHESLHNNQQNYVNPVSFIQTQAMDLSQIRQLNVKIGQSEVPYPTVDDFVMNMEKKRDVAEKSVIPFKIHTCVGQKQDIKHVFKPYEVGSLRRPTRSNLTRKIIHILKKRLQCELTWKIMFICLFYTCLVLTHHVCGFLIAGNTHCDKRLFSLSKSNMTSNSVNNDKKIVIIIGPTASGKTKFSVDLCKKLRECNINPEIINADSMQVYKGFAIGTAKPSDDEVKSVPHHLVGFIEPTEDYNASLFVKDCSRVIDDLLSQDKLPVIVGGTNLYIEGLLWPSVMDFEQNDDNDSLEDEFAEYDSDTLHDMLMEIDPDRAQGLHKNDRKRIIRSLDVYHYHGITHTELMRIRKRERETTGIRYDVMLFLLKSDPEIHRQRIRDRVKSMLQGGILDECKQLMSLKAYKELMPLLTESGEFNSNPDEALLEKCAVVLENKTWQYSQRQRTWINNRLMKYDLKSSVVDTNGMNYSLKNVQISNFGTTSLRKRPELY